MNRFFRGFLVVLHAILPESFLLIGGGLVSYGAHMIYQPAGFIVAGAALIAYGLLVVAPALARKE